jgi:hypothetical protein
MKTDVRNNHPVCWGIDEIAEVIGRNHRQTFHLLAKGEIRSAKKVGGRWCASRDALLRELGVIDVRQHEDAA